MDNTVYAVCNGGPRPSKYIYALQSRLYSLSQQKGTYVLGLFDCCREKIKPEMRGGGPAEPKDDDSGDDPQNSIMWFGCAENGGTDAASDMCE